MTEKKEDDSLDNHIEFNFNLHSTNRKGRFRKATNREEQNNARIGAGIPPIKEEKPKKKNGW